MAKIYDRAVVIEDDESLERLITDPRQFLEEVGALEGISEFNGIQDENGNDITSLQDYFRERGRGSRYYLMHAGIPWSLEHLCHWHLMR